MPSNPNSPSFRHMSMGNSFFASISAARGASSVSHMRFTVSRSASNSSFRWVSKSKWTFEGTGKGNYLTSGPLSGMPWIPDAPRMTSAATSFRRHANGAVEADHLAVEHFVLDDVADELGEFVGSAQSRRKRHLRAQRGADLLAHSL